MKSTSRVGERGQVTIPKRLRRSLGIQPGEELEFEERQGELLLRRAAALGPLDRLVGLVRERVDVDAYLAEARGPAFRESLDAPRSRRASRSPRRRRS
jgi:AbrB family looped-hinge helix DNA binding protein